MVARTLAALICIYLTVSKAIFHMLISTFFNLSCVPNVSHKFTLIMMFTTKSAISNFLGCIIKLLNLIETVLKITQN